MESTQASAHNSRSLVRSAALLSLGNITSRVLGLVREQVITYFFGATVFVSSFRLSDRLLKLLYDFIVGGMLSGALVPVFSEYAATRRDELWRLASILLTLITFVVALIVLLIEVFAHPLARLLAGGQTPAEQMVTAQFFRWMAPAILFMSISSILLALLYALKRFRFAALATAVYNLGIVLGVPLLAHRFDALSLALGVLLGAIFQLLILLPDLRDVRWRVSFYWRHPGVRRIVRLYVPIAFSLVVGMFQGLFDGRLATFTGPSSLAYMANATALVQFPLGLVAMALSYASLPTLSQLAATGDRSGYRSTLGHVLRMVLFLSLPAAVGLFILAQPVVRLLYEHGRFTPTDTFHTARALQVYAIGLIFAALDWPLNYASYARKNTLTPTLVGIGSVGVYLIVALTLMGPLGMLGLVWGDTCKHMSHAFVMLLLTGRHIRQVRLRDVLDPVIKIGLATLVMGFAVHAAWTHLSLWASHQSWGGFFLALLTTVAIGMVVYILAAFLLQLDELRLLFRSMFRRGSVTSDE
ncbi:MAG: murein biosynthesis integral membrane protein MurJ [Chloroflexi bacterium]|nr:murein biosynthesis integral membrane protein MurJ [Chloroflexota bacterium]